MIKTDYSKVSDLFLTYPMGFSTEYESLTNFYEELISIVPLGVHQYLIVNNEEASDCLKDLFPEKNITPVVVKGFDEIWLRDIMGFNVEDKIVKPIYKPSYCKDVYNDEYLTRLNYQVREIINKTIKKEIIDIPLIWDGGNLVTNGKIGIITDKILRDNSDKCKDEILSIIEEYLGIKAVIVPTMKHDLLGHTDGYMAFLSEKKICLSTYPALKFLESDIKYLEELRNILEELGLNILRICERPVDERIGKGNNSLCSSRGCYLNFLQLGDELIFPEFTLPTKRETLFYNSINKDRFFFEGKGTIPINCDKLSKMGGVLHCLSFTI